LRLAADLLERRVIVARDVEQLARVVEGARNAGQRADGRFERLLFPAELLGAFLVAPDAGLGEQLLDFR